MKSTVKTYFKFFIFLFGISLLLVNCERDEVLYDDSQSKFPYKIKVKHFEEFSKDIKFNNAIESLNQNNSYNKNTVNEDFTIDSTSVKEITSDNYTSYTFLIKREVDSIHFFENLVITIDSLETIQSFILKYIPTEEMEYIEHHNSYTFVGDIELSPINYDASGLFSKTETNEFCFPVFTVYCSETGEGDSGTYYTGLHVVNSDCHNSEYFSTVESEECFSTGGTTPTDGDGTGNCPTCGANGTNGNTDEDTQTSIATVTVYNDISAPCKQLKDSISDVPLIKTRLKQLKLAATSGNFEKGLRIDKHPTTSEYIPTEVLNENSGPRRIKITVNPFTVVIAHTHPIEETYAMFSGPDIIKMAEIIKHNQFSSSSTVKPLSITHILITEGKTFALRFDDTESAQKLLGIYNNRKKRRKFIKKLYKLYEEDYSTSGLSNTTIFKQQHHLFALFEEFGLNMSLYEANYDSNGLVDNWQKIIDNNGTLEKQTCK